MWLKLLVLLVAAYAATLALVYLTQTKMLFPTGLAAEPRALSSPAASQLEVETPDGERLRGIRIAPVGDLDPGRLVILGFGGNAWNARNVATYLHGLYPNADVVAFHYRGYRPSSGKPSAAALLSDAPIVYDHVVETLGSRRVVAVGLSIGAAVAAHLSSGRSLAGQILVSPFDSLEALARDHFPWVPVRWLLRHRMEASEVMRGNDTRTAIIAAERDTIVPPRRTESLRREIPAVVFDRTIAGAGHNDLYNRPEFRAAMVEALERLVVSR